jgi:uncharacterized membrane protein YdjX (TVP38/TMEM64 family)
MTRPWGAVLAIVTAGVVIWVIGRLAGEPILRFLTAIETAGAAAPILFASLYVLAVVALVPGSILTLAAGAMFGVVTGVAIVFVAAVAGASLAFLIARYLARPAVERRLTHDERFARIDRAVGRQGLKIVFLLRLTPVVPFNLLNYALGITRVSFRDYVFASVGMLPGTVLYVYSGRLMGELATIAAGSSVRPGVGSMLLLILGLIATTALVILLTKLAREELREETGIGGGTTLEG